MITTQVYTSPNSTNIFNNNTQQNYTNSPFNIYNSKPIFFNKSTENYKDNIISQICLKKSQSSFDNFDKENVPSLKRKNVSNYKLQNKPIFFNDSNELASNNTTSKKKIQIFPPTENSNAIIKTDQLSIKIQNSLGGGASAKVFECEVTPNIRFDRKGVHFSPDKPQHLALRKVLGSKLQQEQFARLEKYNTKTIDPMLVLFDEENYYTYTLHKLYTAGSLDKLDFAKISDPHSFIFNVAFDIAEALHQLHSNDEIHRDVKGANILIMDETGSASLGDPDTISSVKTKSHFTTGTPEYLDAAMFGNASETLIKQLERKGIQTKEGDIYAFGITILRDLLIPFLNFYKKDKISLLLDEVKTITFEGKWSKEELISIGNQYPLRATIREFSNKRVINVSPPVEVIKEKLQEAINMVLSSEEQRLRLCSLVSLACSMIDTIPANRPKAAEILEQLKLQKNIQQEEIEQNNVKDELFLKRKIDFDDWSPTKKVRLEDAK